MIVTDELKEKVRKAIESGNYDTWEYDGETEYPVERFDVDRATDAVVKVITEATPLADAPAGVECQ